MRNTDTDADYVNTARYDDRPIQPVSARTGGFMDIQASMHSSLPKTILVVDDDPSMRLICVKTLRAKGFTVLEAEGSSESLQILATHPEPIDLLLTDLMLPPPDFQMTSLQNPYPRVHGHEVIQRALAMKKTCRVILMSSLSEQERKAYRLVTDQVPFLQKPFSVETMMQLIHAVLEASPLSCDDPSTKVSSKQDVRWYG
jgi:CheY-like chemotaxis protein